MKQVYNARYAYHFSIRGNWNATIKEVTWTRYVYSLTQTKGWRCCTWYFLDKLDAIKLSNACHLVFLIDSTYKTNRYILSLLDIVGMILIGLTFLVVFVYLEDECINNIVWTLERFRGIFMRSDALPKSSLLIEIQHWWMQWKLCS